MVERVTIAYDGEDHAFDLDHDHHRWSAVDPASEIELDEGDYPLIATPGAKRYALYSDHTFSAASLHTVKAVDDTRSFAAGDVVFNAGDVGNEMFVIAEGSVEVSVGAFKATLGPGEMVGEMALVDDHHRRIASVRALSALKVTPIDRNRFEYLIQHDPSFGYEVLRTMADRLRSMDASYVPHP